MGNALGSSSHQVEQAFYLALICNDPAVLAHVDEVVGMKSVLPVNIDAIVDVL